VALTLVLAAHCVLISKKIDMRLYCLLPWLLISLCTCAQNNVADVNTKPLITPFGKAIGDSIVQRMDSKGGIVKSADGKLEVIFAADAIDAETVVSIQPIHNQLMDEDDGSYQLEPSGVTFKKPVQLVFHYTDANENADLKDIAWQDDNGKWHPAKNIVRDTINKTVSGLAPHFSRWASFDRIKLNPNKATVKVNRAIYFKIYSLDDLNDVLKNQYDGDITLAYPSPIHYFSGEWTANGIVNGNSEIGTVTKQDNRDAFYKAPAVVPSANPVAVSVQIFSDKKTRKLLLTSNITVVGEQYRLTYKHFDNSGVFHVIDSSSCIINIEKEKVRISDIINYKPWADGNPGSLCKGAKWTNPDSFRGLIEITGMVSSRVTPPASEGGLPNVYIIFSPALGNTPSFSCKEGGGVPSMPQPALPKDINFDIDGDDVIIRAGGKTGRNQLIMESKNEKNIISIHKL